MITEIKPASTVYRSIILLWMMKITLSVSFMFILMVDGHAQLVTRRDYDAAFALQAGGEVGFLLPAETPKPALTPTVGLKMTFPFTRKWFMGTEVNYSVLKCTHRFTTGDLKADIDLKRIQIPVYLKYMLNSNKAGVLFGIYASRILDDNITFKGPGIENNQESSWEGTPSGPLNRWEGGIMLGYEQRIVKHLNLTFRVSAGAMSLWQKSDVVNRYIHPLQAGLTLSYDILRIGDCGCD